jgi:hypothetical protein
MSVFGKLIGWLVNDVIVNNLANSKRFQRFAVSLDDSITKGKKVLEEKYLKEGKIIFEEKSAQIKENIPKVNPVKFGQVFVKEFIKNIKESINKK